MFHPPPSASSSSRPTPQGPKLRLSCDECAASKVKCDKQRPTCDRCTSNGLSCVYSLSRKFGKPPSKKRLLTQQASLMPASPTPNDLNILSPGRNLMISNIGDGDTFNPTWGDYTIDERLPSMSEFDTMFDFQISEFATRDNSHGAFSPFDNGDAYERELLDGSFASGQQSHTLSTSNVNMISPEPMVVDHSRSNCQYRAYTTLAALYCRTKHSFDSQDGQSDEVNSFPSPLTDLSTFSPPIPPTMDKVLSANKAALATLIELLDCPCANDPHLAFLYASIVFKVLLWYRIASGIRPSSNHFANASSSSSSSQSMPTMFETCKSSSAGLDFQSNDMIPTKIQVGGHILDEEDQIMLRRDLLLLEVRKVGRVIDRMAASGEEQRPGDSKKPKQAIGTQWRVPS